MEAIYHDYYKSPIGLIEVCGNSEAITRLKFVEKPKKETESHPNLRAAIEQVAEYFRGERRIFDVDISFEGTDFQMQVWKKLLTVAYGHTSTYRDLAVAIENPKAVRAVGAANGRNPISLIVPCHRIIGASGHLTGYGSGLEIKTGLLKLEGHQIKDHYCMPF